MKFEYDDTTDKGMPIAILYKFNSEDNRQCLAIRAQSGKFVWFYNHVGLATIQETGFSDEDIIRKFYPGDKITITF